MKRYVSRQSSRVRRRNSDGGHRGRMKISFFIHFFVTFLPFRAKETIHTRFRIQRFFVHQTNEGKNMTFGHSRHIRITSLTSILVYGPISSGYRLREILFFSRVGVKLETCALDFHFRYAFLDTLFSRLFPVERY